MGAICSSVHNEKTVVPHSSPGPSKRSSRDSYLSLQRDRKERLGRNHDSISLPNGKKRKCIIQMTSAIMTPKDLRRIQSTYVDKHVVILTICITIPGSRKSKVVMDDPIIDWGKLRLSRQVPEEVTKIEGQGTTHIFAVLANNSTHNADITMTAEFENRQLRLVSTISSQYLASLDEIHEFAYALQKDKRETKAKHKTSARSSDLGYLSQKSTSDDCQSAKSTSRKQRSYHTMDSVEKSYIKEYGMEQEVIEDVNQKKKHRHFKRQGSGYNLRRTEENIKLDRVIDLAEINEENESLSYGQKQSRSRSVGSERSNGSQCSKSTERHFSSSDVDNIGEIRQFIEEEIQRLRTCRNSVTSRRSDHSNRSCSRTSQEREMDSLRNMENFTPVSGNTRCSTSKNGDSSELDHAEKTEKHRRPTPTVGADASPAVKTKKQRRPSPAVGQVTLESHLKKKKNRRLSPSSKAAYQKKYSPGGQSLCEIPLMEENEDDNICAPLKDQEVKIVEEEIIVEQVERLIPSGCSSSASIDMLAGSGIPGRSSACSNCVHSSLKTRRTKTFRRTKSMPLMIADRI